MIEEISGMPAGTIGLRASGKVSAGDYKTVLEPVLRGAVDPIRPVGTAAKAGRPWVS